MRALLVLLLLPSAALAMPATDDATCGHHGCPQEAVFWHHPVFGRVLGLRGGPSVGVVIDPDDRSPNPDPDTSHLSIGWEARGDALGTRGKIGFFDLLYALHVRARPGEYAIVPSIQIVPPSMPMLPIMSLGVGAGLPIVVRDREAELGAGLYLHQHWFVVVDYRIGVELFPFADDTARLVMSAHVTL